jgi:hypothetical protein
MNIEVGNTVRFLNEKGGGIVIRIDTNDMVQVKTENGFVIPSHRSELVVIPDTKKIIEKEVVKPEKKEHAEPSVPNISYNYATKNEWANLDEIESDLNSSKLNIYIGLIPIDRKNPGFSDLLVYLINDSNYHLLYNYSLPHDDYCQLVSTGNIEPETKLLIHTIKGSELNSFSKFLIQIISFKKGYYTAFQPIDKVVKIKPSRLFKWNSYMPNDYFDERAIIIPLSTDAEMEEDIKTLKQEELIKVIEEKELFTGTKKEESKKAEAKESHIEEYDLHIQNLVEEYRGLSNAEMLITQISHFKTKLENALLRGVKKIVFIHGVGNGTLKHELRKTLDTQYSDLKYQDASFKEYGYGATLVMLSK